MYKKFDNGLQIVVNRVEGLFSVSAGILVKTGSRNEKRQENGISHFIEHVMFKGTQKRSAFQISDDIDSVGAQINAFTSKELTCYYTKSTAEHLEKSLEVLSDIFFNSIFDQGELEKEKGVILEEINMSQDTPEDICLDLLSQGYFGNNGLGRTILGSAKNVKNFTRENVISYMDKYYTADNVVISISGAVDEQKTVELIEKYFANNFTRLKSSKQIDQTTFNAQNLFKYKKIEQSHIAMCMPCFAVTDDRTDLISLANIVFGGGMSSRLFQKIREELGLAYSVYSYVSAYRDTGIFEIYAGVNTEQRDKAFNAIVAELENFQKNGITQKEFLRAKEQMKSAFIMGKESTASQMLLNGKSILFLDREFNFVERLKRLDGITYEQTQEIIKQSFSLDKMATATVGKLKTALK